MSSRAQDDARTAAFALEKQGRNAEAEAAWRALAEQYPKDAEPEAHLGLLEARQEHYGEAVASYRAALEERTRGRVPLEWATSTGNQGVAMMLIADRADDSVLAETALTQIAGAAETLRDGGQAPGAAYFEAQLPKAQAIRDRLKDK